MADKRSKEEVLKRIHAALEARPWIGESAEKMRPYSELLQMRLPDLPVPERVSEDDWDLAYVVYEAVLLPYLHDRIAAKAGPGPTLSTIVSLLEEVAATDQDGEDLVVVGIFEGLFSRMAVQRSSVGLDAFVNSLSPRLRELAVTEIARVSPSLDGPDR